MDEQRSGRGLAWALAGLLAAVVAAALVVVLVVLPGDEPGQLSAAHLVARGDQICKRARDAFVGQQREQPRTARQAAELAERLTGIAEDESGELGDLHGPAGLEQRVDAYIEERKRGIDALRAGAEAAGADDSDGYAKAQADAESNRRDAERLARAIGFRQCSRPLPEP